MTLAKAKALANKTFRVQASLMIVTNDHQNMFIVQAGNTKGGKYHCTVDLLFE